MWVFLFFIRVIICICPHPNWKQKFLTCLDLSNNERWWKNCFFHSPTFPVVRNSKDFSCLSNINTKDKLTHSVHDTTISVQKGMLSAKDWLTQPLCEVLPPRKALCDFLCIPKTISFYLHETQKFLSRVQNSILQIVWKYHFVFHLSGCYSAKYIWKHIFQSRSFTIFLCTPAIYRGPHLQTIVG